MNELVIYGVLNATIPKERDVLSLLHSTSITTHCIYQLAKKYLSGHGATHEDAMFIYNTTQAYFITDIIYLARDILKGENRSDFLFHHAVALFLGYKARHQHNSGEMSHVISAVVESSTIFLSLAKIDGYTQYRKQLEIAFAVTFAIARFPIWLTYLWKNRDVVQTYDKSTQATMVLLSLLSTYWMYVIIRRAMRA